ncbi:spore germination protein GerPC [Paenibacillus chondroitinus]|uniref:Spore germination protein GerPC n=1 Tax=Paenibacillus chondroitinus TaxID=59842 RepID=A0ABU6D879_9BACL|nr:MULTISPECIES: spore germination protein GerPC [Paenibacillus]MCY9661954.1 spore germination protein GerPC [Paenibacillus anseongense]MEB4793640.1 spore germination protein GerPC [Paenibacillus chondroitinus]
MHNSITWQQWAQQLSAYIEMQKQRIDKLEETVTKLQSDLDALKVEKRFHIDKIEYNFDQLKVEKLDGTLTIGISPSSLDNVDDFTVNGASVGKDAGQNQNQDQNPFAQGQGQGQGMGMGTGQEFGIGPMNTGNTRKQQGTEGQAPTGSEMQHDVSKGIAHYLQYGLHSDMLNLENKYQYHLDEDYKDLIIDDIRKQLDARIQHYVNQYRGVGFKEPMEAVTTSIIDRTKQDIISAVESYISSLPRNEG